jgi:peptidoglycan/xylan/chitin deacetylase (PgdA/CDA1 family)
VRSIGFAALAAVATLAAIEAAPAGAKGWPTPAAGSSASGGPEVLFTFDDGPNPKTTPHVLDTLAQHHIHAVFFMVGERLTTKSAKVTALVQRILREGHVIGTHTMHHTNMCRGTEEAAVRDIDDGKATIEAAAGIPTAWFRTPGGARCTRVENLLEERHLHHFHWDLDPQEWKHGNADKAFKYVTDEFARMSGRNVLLMHDVKAATVKALPEILSWLDDENAKRLAAHKKPIVVVQAPALALEQLPAGLPAWLTDVTAGARSLPDELASVLP